jgi:hypothetical protein
MSTPCSLCINRLMNELYAVQPLAEVCFSSNVSLLIRSLRTQGSRRKSVPPGCTSAVVADASWLTTSCPTSNLAVWSTRTSTLTSKLSLLQGRLDHIRCDLCAQDSIRGNILCQGQGLMDEELRAWAGELQGPAKAIDFPDLKTRCALIGALSHVVSTEAHHQLLQDTCYQQGRHRLILCRHIG